MGGQELDQQFLGVAEPFRNDYSKLKRNTAHQMNQVYNHFVNITKKIVLDHTGEFK